MVNIKLEYELLQKVICDYMEKFGSVPEDSVFVIESKTTLFGKERLKSIHFSMYQDDKSMETYQLCINSKLVKDIILEYVLIQFPKYIPKDIDVVINGYGKIDAYVRFDIVENERLTFKELA